MFAGILLFVHIANIQTRLINEHPHGPHVANSFVFNRKPHKIPIPLNSQLGQQIMLSGLVFIVHIYKFVKLQGSVHSFADWCRCAFTHPILDKNDFLSKKTCIILLWNQKLTWQYSWLDKTTSYSTRYGAGIKIWYQKSVELIYHKRQRHCSFIEQNTL